MTTYVCRNPRDTSHPHKRQSPVGVLALALILVALGCQPTGSPDTNPGTPDTTAAVPSPEQMQAQLDDTLEWTFENRHLNLQDHAAWQILHGALAYGREFVVEKEVGGARVGAVDHLLAGGKLNGWTVEAGIVTDEEQGRRGLIAVMEPGSKTGQGHADQWLAVLAQCGLTPQQKILANGETYQMQDFISQVQWDVPRNVQREYSWTLIGLTTYLPTSAQWVAQDDQPWSIERLMEIESEQELSSSACGGSHRLIGMTMALNRHLEQGGSLDGIWKRADEQIQQAIQAAREFQNGDGSFSSNYFQRGGKSADLAQDLGVSGHVLEFLSLATSDAQLREPWVQRGATHLCELFKKTQTVPLECGALYHAAHGLLLFRHRMFGLRTFGGAGPSDESIAKQTDLVE